MDKNIKLFGTAYRASKYRNTFKLKRELNKENKKQNNKELKLCSISSESTGTVAVEEAISFENNFTDTDNQCNNVDNQFINNDEYNDIDDFETDLLFASSNKHKSHNNLPSAHTSTEDEEEKLKAWAVECEVPHSTLDKLLNILRRRLMTSLPQSAKSFLGTTTAIYDVQTMIDSDDSKGEFIYLGVERGLKSCVNTNIHKDNILSLIINIDGMKLRVGGVKVAWPILGKVYFESDIYKPFTIALYVGNHKPKNVSEFLHQFISEINNLQQFGLNIREIHYQVKVKCFVCDTPARAYLKCIKGHNSKRACERCTIEGMKINNVMTFLSKNNCESRTMSTFRNFNDIEHHENVSPLIFIQPQLNMIDDFILDSMHLCFLGVMKRLIDAWMSRDKNFHLSQGLISELCKKMENIKSQQPMEFHRKIRPITDHSNYKATDYRFLLLFGGPILLKNILDKNKYKHFLLLHVACRMLCSKEALRYVEYAKQLLEQFIIISEEIYGPRFVVINVHNLKHIPDDVQNMQCNLNYITAFPFESYLGKIKKLIRSPHNVAAQFARRIHEQELYINKIPSLPSIEIQQQIAGKIMKLRYKEIIITTIAPDNAVILNNKQICIIKEMYTTENNFKANVEILKVKNSVYKYPCDSALVNIFELYSETAVVIKNSIFLNTVLSKVIILKPNLDDSNVFALALLH